MIVPTLPASRFLPSSLCGGIVTPGHRAVAELGGDDCCLRGTGTIVVTRQSVGDPVTHPSSRPAIPFIHIAFSRLRGKNRSPIRPVAHGPAPFKPDAQIAQLVEQRIENPRVAGSIPALGTTTFLCREQQAEQWAACTMVWLLLADPTDGRPRATGPDRNWQSGFLRKLIQSAFFRTHSLYACSASLTA